MNRMLLLLRWIVILGMPVVVVLTSARSLVSPWFPRYEYGKPGFPQDTYGLSSEQRLALATVAIDHLNTRGGPSDHIYMLSDQRLPGSAEPLYTPAEIGHMVDVKDFTNRLWHFYTLSLLLVGGSLAVLFLPQGGRVVAAQTLLLSGLAALGSLLALALLVLVGWSIFFTQFHRIFFPMGNWTFDYAGSLIRLFPQQFWFDGALLLVGGAFTAAATVAGLGSFLRDRLQPGSVG